ncbi:MAG: M28 family peptidase [Myxococcota bacterium]
MPIEIGAARPAVVSSLSLNGIETAGSSTTQAGQVGLGPRRVQAQGALALQNPTAVGVRVHAGPSNADSLKRIVDDVVQGPRASAAERAQSRVVLRDYLEAYGFSVVEENYGSGTNVLGVLAGNTHPHELVYLSAHYDTVPHCDGANDNGSAMAAALEIARQLAAQPNPRTLVVAFWDEEELGLVGARAHDPATTGIPAAEPVLNMNLDAVGIYSDEPGSQVMPPGLEYAAPLQYREIARDGFRGDFITLISDLPSFLLTRRAARSVESEGLDAVTVSLPRWAIERFAPDLRRSDHAAFWDKGVPAVFVTDSANFRSDHYHCRAGEDDAGLLDFERMSRLTNGLTPALSDALKP